MKYREKKSNITEYKQKEIQGKKPITCTLTPYKEEHGGSSSRWGCKRSSTMDRGQRNRRREDRQKLQKNSKNTETDTKNTAKHQNKNRNGGGGG
jgi:hypothetical protein